VPYEPFDLPRDFVFGERRQVQMGKRWLKQLEKMSELAFGFEAFQKEDEAGYSEKRRFEQFCFKEGCRNLANFLHRNLSAVSFADYGNEALCAPHAFKAEFGFLKLSPR
jgi:hypothetical protein